MVLRALLLLSTLTAAGAAHAGPEAAPSATEEAGSWTVEPDGEAPPGDDAPPPERTRWGGLLVGSRVAASVVPLPIQPLGVDVMPSVGLEIPTDDRTSVRLDVSVWPQRNRVHVAVGGRAYPAGHRRTTWYGELTFHLQHTGGTERSAAEWVPGLGRGWSSVPFFAGAGWKTVFAGDRLVLDMMVSGGPSLEVRPQGEFPVLFGLAATAGVYLGVVL